MNKFADQISYILAGVFVIALGSVVGGTLLYLLWEDSITAMFPTAVKNGHLAGSLTWWQSVKIVWVFTLLVKVQHNVVNKTPNKSQPQSSEQVN